MIICSPFSDKRTRIQAMMRIRRYTDQGMYVENDQVDQIDKSSLAKIKGKICGSLEEIKKMTEKSNKSKISEKSEA